MKRLILALLLLGAVPALAAVTTLKGVDKMGRHFAITLTGKLSKQDLPPDDAMAKAQFDVAAYLRGVCDAKATRCDVYAGYDNKLNLAPGYIIAVTAGGVTSYRPEFVNRAGDAPRFNCLGAGKAPPAVLTGKDVLEGRGPVVLLRAGPDAVRLAYNKAYGCKVEIDDKFDLIGSLVFEH